MLVCCCWHSWHRRRKGLEKAGNSPLATAGQLYLSFPAKKNQRSLPAISAGLTVANQENWREEAEKSEKKLESLLKNLFLWSRNLKWTIYIRQKTWKYPPTMIKTWYLWCHLRLGFTDTSRLRVQKSTPDMLWRYEDWEDWILWQFLACLARFSWKSLKSLSCKKVAKSFKRHC